MYISYFGKNENETMMIPNESEKRETSCSSGQLIRTGTGYAVMTDTCKPLKSLSLNYSFLSSSLG